MTGGFENSAPPEALENSRNLYLWLTSQGMPHQQAYEAAVNRFGRPKSPEEQQKEAAKGQQKAGFAQAGGTIAGLIGAQQLGSLFSGGAGAAGAGAAGATGAGAVGAAGAGAAGGAAAGGAAGGTAAGTGAAGTAASGSTLGAIGSVALPAAVGAAVVNNAWETGMKDIVRGRGDRADWTNQLANVSGYGLAANIGLRLAGKRSIGAMVTSGKSAPQKIRDDFRGDLKESGVADDNYNVTLADGSKFNIGLDGKTKLQNVGENVDGKTTRNAYDVDWSNPLAKFATEKIDPTIRNIYGDSNSKAKYFPEQFTGMLVNAATSNAKTEAEVLANIETMLGSSKFAQQAGVGVQPPPPPKPPKGEVVRVSPGMYMNDKGQIKPATSIRQALQVNYNSSKKKEKR